MFEVSRKIGERASGEQIARVESVIARLSGEAAGAPSGAGGEAGFSAEASAPPPDLLGDLAGAIRSRIGAEADGRRGRVGFDAIDDEGSFVAGVNAGEEGRPATSALSVDAIGAAVAIAFGGRDLRPIPDAAVAVSGALLMAMSTAEEQVPPLGLEVPARLVEEVPIRAPWEVSHPLLLDPVIWMVSTAYTE